MEVGVIIILSSICIAALLTERTKVGKRAVVRLAKFFFDANLNEMEDEQ